MLPRNVRRALEPHLGGSIENHEPVGGGCIAHASRVDTGQCTYFLKWSAGEVAATFSAEADGLEALRAAQSPLRVPEVVHVQTADDDGTGLLVLEWIETGEQPPGFWEDFGHGLAEMHRHESDCYGFDRDNFIGRLPQRNEPGPRWPDFFATCRIAPQVDMARENGRWPSDWDELLDALVTRLDDLLPAQPPRSILHGDLWGGNFMVAADGRGALFDPAAYYGHREADLAMTELFGGFDRRFYDAYRDAWSLEPGYEERREVYNLYHLINHLNHFGRSYTGHVERILRRFG